jgi:raffinose/stachyose/melibiose transport system permease protein
MNNSKTGYWIAKVMVLIAAAAFTFPFYISFVYAFKSNQEIAFIGIAFPKQFHWENFSKAIEMSNFFSALKNSLLTTIPTVLILTLVCSMATYVIARNNNLFYNAWFYLFLGAILIPFQAIMLPLYINLKNWGLLNTVSGFVLTKAGFLIAYTILIVTGFVKGIPKEMEESAGIDGAHPYTVFWRIVFPLLKPIVLTSVILNTLYTWNDFEISLIVLQKNDIRTLPLMQYFFFGENSSELNLAFATFILSMIPILILYFILQRYIITGIMTGAVKG